MALVLSAEVRVRREYFGALAWRPGRPEVHRLDEIAAAAALYYLHPRPGDPGGADWASLGTLLGTTAERWLQACSSLCAFQLLEPHGGDCFRREALEDLGKIQAFLGATKPTKEIAKPFWVHIQPFSQCNQRCLHCYCEGSPSASPLQLSQAQWHDIIARLDDYGVFEVYITGGETLAFPQFFDLAKDILDRGLGFGLSTNGTVASSGVLSKLAGLGIKNVQVSLDGADAATHDHIRGTKGAFRRFKKGVSQLARVCEPVINTVVSSWNLDQLERIVLLGKELGCREFKFYPQKPVGRSLLHRDRCLSDVDIFERMVPECRRLQRVHSVKIETVDLEKPCGSGISGFALDEVGDVYPCIFGIRSRGQRCGNILQDDLDALWFDSPRFEHFRSGKIAGAHCRSCEPL